MNLLHISAQKPDSTGSGIYMSGVIKSFLGRHNQSMIIGLDKNDDIEKIEKKFQNEVGIYPVLYNTVDLDFDVPGMSDNMPYPSTRYRDITDEMAVSIKKQFIKVLKKAIDEINPDIIICHHLYFITSIVKEYYPNKKVVAICHGTCLRQLNTNNFMKDYIIENIKKIDKILALHEKQKKEIESFFGIDKEKVDVLGSGYDSDVFYRYTSIESDIDESNFSIKLNMEKNDDNKIFISYAGKLSYSKGLMEFFDAMNNLSFPTDQVEILIAGDGSDINEKQNIVSKGNQCKYKTNFLGRLDQASLCDVLNKSKIFVLPSYYEGLPLVILEAMACGNYVVCTDVDGISAWLGNDVVSSGIIDFVSLPEMKDITTPKEDSVNGFVYRLNKSIEKAIYYRQNDDKTYCDISSLSWNGLGKKLETFFDDILKKNYSKKGVRYVVLDYRIDSYIIKYFESQGLEVILTKPINSIIPAIDGHVDIQMFFDGKKIFIAKENYEYYMEKFDKSYLENKGIEVICGDKNLEKKYPKDVLYNLCYTGKYYIGNYDFLDKNLKEYIGNNNKIIYSKKKTEEIKNTISETNNKTINKNNSDNTIEKEFIDIKQGYSNCSICVVDNDKIITSDRGIYDSINNYNVNNESKKIHCILIEHGDINLFELDYGFIGGCSARNPEENKIYFFGCLNTHKSGINIKEFITDNDIEYVELFDPEKDDRSFKDFGGAYFI